MKCLKCNRENKANAKFCAYCGNDLSTQTAVDQDQKNEERKNENMVRCTKCNHENKATAKFCAYCGNDLSTQTTVDRDQKNENMIRCTKCDHENKSNAKFCAYCGASLLITDSTKNSEEIKNYETVEQSRFKDNTFESEKFSFQSQTSKLKLFIADMVHKKWPIVIFGICILFIIGLIIFSIVHCDHEWVEATCTEATTCSLCGKTEGEALGHDWKDATCVEPKTCSRCGNTEGEALGHDWKDATCTEPKTCSRCGDTEGEALGHDIEKWEVTKEASCTETGEKQAVCSRCNETVVEEIGKKEHTAGKWKVTKEATLTTKGVRTKSCTECGEELETEEYELTEKEYKEKYKEQCDTTYSYETIARDPDDYIGEYAYFKGEVIQVMESDGVYTLRVNITSGDYYWSDPILVVYTAREGDSRILEDDIVTMYGMLAGDTTYETVLGASVTIPLFYAEYIEQN